MDHEGRGSTPVHGGNQFGLLRAGKEEEEEQQQQHRAEESCSGSPKKEKDEKQTSSTPSCVAGAGGGGGGILATLPGRVWDLSSSSVRGRVSQLRGAGLTWPEVAAELVNAELLSPPVANWVAQRRLYHHDSARAEDSREGGCS